MNQFFNKFHDYILRVLKGMGIGVACIIPGVSGGTLAVILNIYDQLLEAIGNIFSHFKKSMCVLIPVALGAIFAILALVFPIKWALNYALLPIVSLFVGFIIGGIFPMSEKVMQKPNVGGTVGFVLAAALAIGICFIPSSGAANLISMNFTDYLILFAVGIVASITLIIPGISGSMLLMIIGFYTPIITLASELLQFQNLSHNILVFFVFALGIIVGFFAVSKFMHYCLKKHTYLTYMCIMGFIIASVFSIFYVTFQEETLIINALQISFSVILGVIGIAISLFIGYYKNIKEKYLHKNKGETVDGPEHN